MLVQRPSLYIRNYPIGFYPQLLNKNIDQAYLDKVNKYNAFECTLPSNNLSGIPSIWSKTTLNCSSVGWSRVNSPTSKMGHFSYALGSKCVNFQQNITSDTSWGMPQTLERMIYIAKYGIIKTKKTFPF